MHNYGEVQRKHDRSVLQCVSVCVCAFMYVVYACLRTCACVYAWYSSDSLFIMLCELVLSVKWGMRECVLHSEWERQLSWACPLTPHHHSAIAFAAGKELKIEAVTRLPKRLIVKPRYPLGQATCLPVTGLHKHLNDVPPVKDAEVPEGPGVSIIWILVKHTVSMHKSWCVERYKMEEEMEDHLYYF